MTKKRSLHSKHAWNFKPGQPRPKSLLALPWVKSVEAYNSSSSRPRPTNASYLLGKQLMGRPHCDKPQKRYTSTAFQVANMSSSGRTCRQSLCGSWASPACQTTSTTAQQSKAHLEQHQAGCSARQASVSLSGVSHVTSIPRAGRLIVVVDHHLLGRTLLVGRQYSAPVQITRRNCSCLGHLKCSALNTGCTAWCRLVISSISHVSASVRHYQSPHYK